MSLPAAVIAFIFVHIFAHVIVLAIRRGEEDQAITLEVNSFQHERSLEKNQTKQGYQAGFDSHASNDVSSPPSKGNWVYVRDSDGHVERDSEGQFKSEWVPEHKVVLPDYSEYLSDDDNYFGNSSWSPRRPSARLSFLSESLSEIPLSSDNPSDQGLIENGTDELSYSFWNLGAKLIKLGSENMQDMDHVFVDGLTQWVYQMSRNTNKEFKDALESLWTTLKHLEQPYKSRKDAEEKLLNEYEAKKSQEITKRKCTQELVTGLEEMIEEQKSQKEIHGVGEGFAKMFGGGEYRKDIKSNDGLNSSHQVHRQISRDSVAGDLLDPDELLALGVSRSDSLEDLHGEQDDPHYSEMMYKFEQGEVPDTDTKIPLFQRMQSGWSSDIPGYEPWMGNFRIGLAKWVERHGKPSKELYPREEIQFFTENYKKYKENKISIVDHYKAKKNAIGKSIAALPRTLVAGFEKMMDKHKTMNDIESIGRDYTTIARKPLLAQMLFDTIVDTGTEKFPKMPRSDAQAQAQLLISNNADVNLPDLDSGSLRPLLAAAWAKDVDLVKLLLTHNAEVNHDKPERAAYQAAGNGAVKVLSVLAEHGAVLDRMEKPGSLGWTPIMVAVANDHVENVQFLIRSQAVRPFSAEHADLNNFFGQDVFDIAATSRKISKKITQALAKVRSWPQIVLGAKIPDSELVGVQVHEKFVKGKYQIFEYQKGRRSVLRDGTFVVDKERHYVVNNPEAIALVDDDDKKKQDSVPKAINRSYGTSWIYYEMFARGIKEEARTWNNSGGPTQGWIKRQLKQDHNVLSDAYELTPTGQKTLPQLVRAKAHFEDSWWTRLLDSKSEKVYTTENALIWACDVLGGTWSIQTLMEKGFVIHIGGKPQKGVKVQVTGVFAGKLKDFNGELGEITGLASESPHISETLWNVEITPGKTGKKTTIKVPTRNLDVQKCPTNMIPDEL